MNGEILKTRDQRVVHRLTQLLPADGPTLEKARARARALPAMLRRHGLMQVLLFLGSRGAANGDDATSTQNDPGLAIWLLSGVASEFPTEAGALPDEPSPEDPTAYAGWLAGVDLFTYLQRWETAVEVAGWLKMLIEARCPARSSSPPVRETP